MLNKCPLCSTPLINGTSTANVYDYSAEDLDRITNNIITAEELYEINARTPQYYYRTRLCPNSGNGDTYTNKDGGQPLHPPCRNYHGGNTGNPAIVVETIKIYDN